MEQRFRGGASLILCHPQYQYMGSLREKLVGLLPIVTGIYLRFSHFAVEGVLHLIADLSQPAVQCPLTPVDAQLLGHQYSLSSGIRQVGDDFAVFDVPTVPARDDLTGVAVE